MIQPGGRVGGAIGGVARINYEENDFDDQRLKERLRQSELDDIAGNYFRNNDRQRTLSKYENDRNRMIGVFVCVKPQTFLPLQTRPLHFLCTKPPGIASCQALFTRTISTNVAVAVAAAVATPIVQCRHAWRQWARRRFASFP